MNDLHINNTFIISALSLLYQNGNANSTNLGDKWAQWLNIIE